MSSGSPVYFLSERWLKLQATSIFQLHWNLWLWVAMAGTTSSCRKPSALSCLRPTSQVSSDTLLLARRILGPSEPGRLSRVAFYLPRKEEKRTEYGDHWSSLPSCISSTWGGWGGGRREDVSTWSRQWKKWAVSLDHLPEGTTTHLLCLNKNLSQYFVSTLWVYKMKHWPTSLGTRHLKHHIMAWSCSVKAKPFKKHLLLWLFWIKTVYNIREESI